MTKFLVNYFPTMTKLCDNRYIIAKIISAKIDCNGR